MADILVFKTNIFSKADLLKLAACMKDEKRIKQWSIDREDCDRILRVDTEALQACDVIELVNQAGYACEELM